MAVAISLTPIPNFDPHGEANSVFHRWEKWTRSFDTFAIATGCTNDAQKRQLLLHCAGSDVQDIFYTLTETGTSFAEAKSKLDEYFAPKKNVPYNRHMFRQASQGTDESVNQFVTRLRTLSIGCDFGNNLEDFLRDQVIEKCTSNNLRKKLLAETDLKLPKVLKIASALETSEVQSAHMSGTTNISADSRTEAVNAVKSPRQAYGRAPGYSARGRGKSRSQNHSPAVHQDRNNSVVTCTKCGMKNHSAEDCRCSRNITCYACNRRGHFASMCRTQQRNKSHRPGKQNKVHLIGDTQTHTEDEYLFAFSGELPTYTVEIANQPVNVLIDSGSSCNIISSTVVKQLELTSLVPCDRTIHPYKSKPLHVKEQITTAVSANGKTATTDFLIIPGHEVTLLGRKTAIELNLLRIGPPAAVNAVDSAITPDVQKLLTQYPGIATGIGKLKDYQVTFHINRSVPPVARTSYRVPFHLRPKVEDEIKKLLDADIIEPAEGPTEWVSRIVTPPKPHDPNQIRLCVDMRDANEAIQRVRHVTPTLDDLISDLNGATIFSKIDLRAGYHQLELAPESRDITTFATHQGLYRYKRLNFGVNAAAEIFQKAIQSVISGIPGTRNISDDIIIYGKTQSEHDIALHAVMSRLQSNGLTVNPGKVQLNKSCIEFFGVVFSQNGISPSPSKVRALQNCSPPTTVSEVKSFLGLAQYCARFICDFSTLSAPLRALTCKGAKWKFGLTEQNSFDSIRSALSEITTNAYFDPRKLTEVLVDASPVGISAILTQEGQPVTFSSRSLTTVEQRYSQLEREALAITWACEQLNIYLQGHHFIVLTDHKPLLGIWKKPNLPLRLSRWALRLQSYNMSLKYRPGHDNPADYMSRHPVSIARQPDNYVEAYVNFVMTTSLPKAVTLETVKSATAADHTLQKVIQMHISGKWPTKHTDCDIDKSLLDSFRQVSNELTFSNGVLFRDTRIVIPKSLQKKVINLAHEGHQGISKTKSLLRSKVWFPGIDSAVEATIRNCLPCQANDSKPRAAPVIMSTLPEGPWISLSVDFCGPLPSGEYLLVITDDYSRYPVVEIVPSTSASIVIPRLEKVFALFSYPDVIRTDNGPPFQGKAWADFMECIGCAHRKVTPLWPQANGLVEAFNKPLMKAIRIAHMQGLSYKRELHNFLQAYRVTPHTTTQQTPFRLLFGRDPATKLPRVPAQSTSDDSLTRNTDTAKKAKAKRYADSRKLPVDELEIGDTVIVRQPYTNKLSTRYDPTPLTVTDIKGTMITAVKPNGSTVTRNISHYKRISSGYHDSHSDEDDDIFSGPEFDSQEDPDAPVIPRDVPDAPLDVPMENQRQSRPTERQPVRRSRRAHRTPKRLIDEM